MPLAQSRVTAQGQISVPTEVRRRLGIGPGSLIEWEQEGDKLVVRRAAKYGMEELHKALFPRRSPRRKGAPKSAEDMNEGIRTYIQDKHAQGTRAKTKHARR
jgi:AbrB family looped-hinge helix DNA binding protein